MHTQFLIGKLSEAAVVSNYLLRMIDGIQMSLWGIAWLTCLCGSMEDAWRQNCRLALERNSLGSSIPMKAFLVWDVENMWLQNNLIWIGSCREMKGVWDLKNKKTGKFYGLRTHKTHHGWQQLQWCQATCSWTFLLGTGRKHLKDGQPQVTQPEKAIWVFRMPILGGCVLCMGMVRKLFNILTG